MLSFSRPVHQTEEPNPPDQPSEISDRFLDPMDFHVVNGVVLSRTIVGPRPELRRVLLPLRRL
jgi:hypothetical protein